MKMTFSLKPLTAFALSLTPLAHAAPTDLPFGFGPIHDIINAGTDQSHFANACIDICNDINYGDCVTGLCAAPAACIELNQGFIGLSSLRLDKGVGCTLYEAQDCWHSVVPDGTNSRDIFESVANFNDIGFNDVTQSLLCFGQGKP
jgi:hypothetical protein